MKLDGRDVGEMLLDAVAERVKSERQLSADIASEMLLEVVAERVALEGQLQAALAEVKTRGDEIARLVEEVRAEIAARNSETTMRVEELRADLSHERAETQSRSDTQAALEAITKNMEGTNRQLAALALRVTQREPAASAPVITMPKFVVERGLDGKVKALIPK